MPAPHRLLDLVDIDEVQGTVAAIFLFPKAHQSSPTTDFTSPVRRSDSDPGK